MCLIDAWINWQYQVHHVSIKCERDRKQCTLARCGLACDWQSIKIQTPLQHSGHSSNQSTISDKYSQRQNELPAHNRMNVSKFKAFLVP